MVGLAYEDFVDAHFHVTSRYGNEVMAMCIFHTNTRSASLQINLDTGKFICFSCHASGGPKSLFRELGVPFTDMEADLSIIINRLDKWEVEQRKGGSHRLRLYPENYLKQFDIPSRYWAKRGLTPETVKRFELGCNPMGGYHTIPLRNYNKSLLGVVKRKDMLEEDEKDRYRYPKGFHKAFHLYGEHLIAEDEQATTVALVEGALDAIPIWQAGLYAAAIYGSSFTEHQARLLVRLGVERVILWFDHDKAGKDAAQTALGIHTNRREGKRIVTYSPETDARQFFDVLQVVWPDTPYPAVDDPTDYAYDPGSLHGKHIRKMWDRAVPVH